MFLINSKTIKDSTWWSVLAKDIHGLRIQDKSVIKSISTHLENEKKQGHIVYPQEDKILSVFDKPFEDIKVVILGQDPYHGEGQAHGLSFSVPPFVKIPPSLKNIFKEISRDLHYPMSDNGYLESWAEQGVFLLNSIMSVRRSSPLSHKDIGWEIFSDYVISCISQYREGIVFLLWGNYAKGKSILIDERKHLILKTTHPSPFSFHRGYLGCSHFSKANNYLEKKGIKPIDWSIAPLSEDFLSLL